MEKGISCKSVEVSNKFKSSRTLIYVYTIETFGYLQAENYLQLIEKALSTLSDFGSPATP